MDYFIDEIAALLDIARDNGYEGTYDDFKNILLNDPEELRRIMPYQSAGPDFRSGGLVSLGYLLWEATSPRTEVQKL